MKLLPSLFDRLVLEPDAGERALDSEQLLQHVIRDLEDLIATGRLPDSEGLVDHPEVARSVLNYGIPDIVGRRLNDEARRFLEVSLREAIRTFEPRIDAKSLQVRVQAGAGAKQHGLSFVIRGEVWGQPFSLPLYLRTEVDLETGAILERSLKGDSS